MQWPDPKDDLPEGTDTIIAGASTTENEEALIVREPTARDKALEKIKSGSGKLSARPPTRRADWSARAWSGRAKRWPTSPSWSATPPRDSMSGSARNMANMPARPPARSRKRPTSIAAKDADELIDDTREFVRKSPGVALAGAAIIGFALVRLVKSGLDQDKNDES